MVAGLLRDPGAAAIGTELPHGDPDRLGRNAGAQRVRPLEASGEQRLAPGAINVQAGWRTAGSTCRAGMRITLDSVAQVSGPGLVQFVADGGLVLGWAAARVEDEPAVGRLHDDLAWFGGNVRAGQCPVELAGPVLVRYHQEGRAGEPPRRGERGVSGGSDLRRCHDGLRSSVDLPAHSKYGVRHRV